MTRTRTRLDPKERKALIIEAAVTVAERDGLSNVTRDLIAKEAGISPSLITNYYNTMPQLRRDLMRYAIKHQIDSVVAQGIVLRDKHAMKLSDDERRAFMSRAAV